MAVIFEMRALTVEIFEHLKITSPNNVDDTFRFKSKSLLLTFSCRLSTIVQLWKPRVAYTLVLISNDCHPKTCGLDYNSNRTRGIGYFLEKNKLNWLNSRFFNPNRASSVFLPPLLVLHPKFEFYLEFTHRRLVKKSTRLCWRSFLVVSPTPQPFPTAILNMMKLKLHAVLHYY